MAVSGAAYDKAHALVAGWGRVVGQPFNVTDRIGRRVLGSRFSKVRTFFARLPSVICGSTYYSARALTLAEFIERNPRGRFYVCTRDHAFAIRNGTLLDLRPGLVSDDSEIDSAWRVSA